MEALSLKRLPSDPQHQVGWRSSATAAVVAVEAAVVVRLASAEE